MTEYHNDPYRADSEAQTAPNPAFPNTVFDETHKTMRRRKPKTQSDDAPIKLDRPIVLVGLMGAGKTTVGRRLSRRLGLSFIDSDQEIEKAAGMSVAEIFEAFGEAEFRAGERRVIARLVTDQPIVLATGGGAFMDAETRALLQETAITMWLDADLDTLVERTGRRDTRPLLRDGNRRDTLARLLEKRAPVYQEAHIRVESGPGPHNAVVDLAMDALAAHLGGRLPDQDKGAS